MALSRASVARAEDPTAVASRISDGAFAMLNGLHGRGASSANAMVGAVAIFAGDAQALSRMLAAGDRDGAPSALATLESDRDAVDGAVATNPGLLNAGYWKKIKGELAALAKVIGPAPGAAPARSAGAAAGASASAASAAAARAAPSATGPPVTATGPPVTAAAPPPAAAASSATRPRVEIESRTAEGSGVRVKGYLEGNSLKRGGIYAGGEQLRAFKIGSVIGEQRINFDIGVESPAPGAVIRVYDADGQSAEAPIADATVAAAGAENGATASGGRGRSETADTPEVPALGGASASTAVPSTEGGVEVFRNNREGDSGLASVNTAEIPSHGAPRKSPSKRRTIGSHLGNVQVTITAANLIDPVHLIYELAGQIEGQGITRAGIYVHGRLVRPITAKFGSKVKRFHEQFVLKDIVGDVTIRAYGVGEQFVESSVDLSTAMASAGIPDTNPMTAGGSMLSGPTIENDSGLMVEIAAVGQITRNLYVVSGVISGRNLSAAGLYQNGMLVQRIAVRGNGIGGVIGALIPGASHNVSFNVRFNPQAGPAAIRAFDSSGGYNEQPVIVGTNPYGGTNP
jgi:hypothetical protein